MAQDKTQANPKEETKAPIFQEIENMGEKQSIDVLIQASQLAQNSGKLSVRDSVMLAKAIDILKPGIL